MKNFGSLERNQVMESTTFELGSFKWGICFLRGTDEESQCETVTVFVLSYNSKPVHASVRLEIGNQSCTKYCVVEDKLVACPFGSIHRQLICMSQLMGSTRSRVGDLVIEVDLHNIREATVKELRKAENKVKPVCLEIIDHGSIDEALNNGEATGILSSTCEQQLKVSRHSLVRLWAEHVCLSSLTWLRNLVV